MSYNLKKQNAKGDMVYTSEEVKRMLAFLKGNK